MAYIEVSHISKMDFLEHNIILYYMYIIVFNLKCSLIFVIIKIFEN